MTQPFDRSARLYGDALLVSGDRILESDATVYDRHRDALIRYATAIVGPSQAEDVVSTVVLRTISKRTLSSLDRPDAYLFRAVLNESRSRMRRPQPVELPEEIGHVDGELHDDTVLQAVLSLPTQQRAATYLVYWEDRTNAEAADLMGVRTGTVKRYLHDARKTLGKVLGEDLSDDL